MNKDYKLYVHISPSGKRYYGITKQEPSRRWKNGKGYKGNQYFYRAIEKYGWDNFTHETLFDNLTKEEAKLMEKFYIELYDSTNLNKGYNILNGGDAFEGLKGKLNGMYDVHRYGEDNPMYGKKHTDESREKISKNHADLSGGKNPNAKAIINKSTGKIYPSAREIAEEYGVTPSAITKSIRKGHKSCGYYWEYVNIENNQEAS